MTSRNLTLDMLKLLMAFMVVGMHAGFLENVSQLWNYLTVNGVFRIAVPVFLLINGFYFHTIISKGEQNKWIKRVVALYISWMLFYSYYWFNFTENSLIETLKLIHTVFIGYHHLWYVSGMLWAGIMLLLTRYLSTKNLIFISFFTFLMGVFIQYSGNYHLYSETYLDKLFNHTWSHRNFIFFSYPFLCIGFLINKHSILEKVSTKTISLICLIGLMLLFFESILNYYQPKNDGGFDNYISLIIACPSIFILFMKVKLTGKSKNIALYASAIYFIHFIILDFLRDIATFNGTTLTFIVFTISSMASFFIIKLNKKIKFIL